MGRMAAFMHRKAPLRLVWMTLSKSSSFMAMARPSRVMPALLTRIWMPPSSLTAVSIRVLAASGSATSPWTARTCTPRASSSCSVCWAAAALPAYEKTTLAPRRASSRQMARPMPRLPPVTTAVFPLMLPISFSFQRRAQGVDVGAGLHRDGLDGGSGLFDKAAQHLAGADLHDGVHAQSL